MTVTVLTILTGNDNALQAGDTGTVTADSLSFNVRNSTTLTTRRHFGMRLQHATVTIPQGAAIASAIVSLTNSHSTIDDANCDVYGHDVDATLNYATVGAGGDPTLFTRTRTTATVNFAVSNAVLNTTQTIDVTTIFQEIVDRPGYNPANGITLLFIGRSTGSENYFAYGRTETTPPFVTVDWSVSTPPPVGVVDSVHGQAAESVRVFGFGDTAVPTIVQDTPDGINFVTDTTPTLEFTGYDADAPDYLTYQIQISNDSTFDDTDDALEDNFAGGSGGSFHSNPLGTLTWEGTQQLDDRFGQSFTGAGGWLHAIEMRMGNDQGNASYPDGTAYVRVYEHAGTFGTSSAPANAAADEDTPTPGWLAKSDALILTPSMSTSATWLAHTFTDENRIYLEPGVRYMLITDWVPNDTNNLNTFSYSGDGNNSGVLHGGNMYVDGDSPNWGVHADWDLHFRVYEGDILLDKSSDTDPGFLNISNITQYDPFIAGEQISYTVPDANALTPDITYYWRVRAIDPYGSNTFSLWSPTQTFQITEAVGIASAGHGHLADNVTVQEATVISVAVVDGAHSHTVDAVGVAQTHIVNGVNSAHAQSADVVTATQTNTIVIVEGLHSHTSETVTVSQTQQISIVEGVHGHLADAVTITQTQSISVVDSTHGHLADTVTVFESNALVPVAAVHSHTVDAVAITQSHVIGIAETSHTLLADAVPLQQSITVAGVDSNHIHQGENVTITQTHLIPVTDAASGVLVDVVAVVTTNVVAVRDGGHPHQADAVAVASEAPAVGIGNALHSHLVETVVILQAHVIGAVDAIHLHQAGNASFFMGQMGTPAHRKFNVDATAGDRAFSIGDRERIFVVEERVK
jgi:hypothetical protein